MTNSLATKAFKTSDDSPKKAVHLFQEANDRTIASLLEKAKDAFSCRKNAEGLTYETAAGVTNGYHKKTLDWTAEQYVSSAGERLSFGGSEITDLLAVEGCASKTEQAVGDLIHPSTNEKVRSYQADVFDRIRSTFREVDSTAQDQTTACSSVSPSQGFDIYLLGLTATDKDALDNWIVDLTYTNLAKIMNFVGE
ncbi:hypothetical protein I302_103073 [Kwoniella bestiolae CBS 10118]|uniref:Uncharacterized protein n=1 Tax=Kwoniella bestiolae CBS 10118 TaxID=1296100 RepID=A0A1B9GGS7_9TREE|nr:hypothetical protein I302_01772 [Kwoniella bestiolae CBS 10118]OCF30253.1 hypothetical protein I302_01772 [Kwoniella bestiolae CBS 10118]